MNDADSGKSKPVGSNTLNPSTSIPALADVDDTRMIATMQV